MEYGFFGATVGWRSGAVVVSQVVVARETSELLALSIDDEADDCWDGADVVEL